MTPMSVCGVWYRAGSCILAPRHDGLHLTQEQAEAAQDRAELEAAKQLIAGLRETLDITQTALRRYMSGDGGCDCLQCDEGPPETVCCSSCWYCHGRYALGEIELKGSA